MEEEERAARERQERERKLIKDKENEEVQRYNNEQMH